MKMMSFSGTGISKKILCAGADGALDYPEGSKASFNASSGNYIV